MDTPEMEQQVRVTDDGTVPLAYIGSVHVAGQTPATAATMIQKALDRQKSDASAPGDRQDRGVGDPGCIGTGPGAYARHLLHHDAADDSESSVARRRPERHGRSQRDSETAPNQGSSSKYLVSNDADEALSDVVMVYPGDTVLVARAPMVYVMGDVSRPGGYAIATNDARLSVLQVIAMAGSANKTSMTVACSPDPDNRSWPGRDARSSRSN